MPSSNLPHKSTREEWHSSPGRKHGPKYQVQYWWGFDSPVWWWAFLPESNFSADSLTVLKQQHPKEECAVWISETHHTEPNLISTLTSSVTNTWVALLDHNSYKYKGATAWPQHSYMRLLLPDHSVVTNTRVPLPDPNVVTNTRVPLPDPNVVINTRVPLPDPSYKYKGTFAWPQCSYKYKGTFAWPQCSYKCKGTFAWPQCSYKYKGTSA